MPPGTFVYPIAQRWFANQTQMGSEPVDAGRDFFKRKVYYHVGSDIGAPEGLADIIAAADADVVALGTETVKDPDPKDTPIEPRYDVIYLRDGRNWYYRYSHLQSFDPAIKLGGRVRMGQRLGVAGKEGGSGGWSHLHFEVKSRQPNGRWGSEDAYPFIWEAYLRQYAPKVVAVSRPRHLTVAGEKVTLDGSKSWSADGKIARYDWTFTDGSKATGATIVRAYDHPGTYSEILKVTDSAGNFAYDFAIVQVLDPAKLGAEPAPRIHVTYAPSLDVRVGDLITFKGRTFETTEGEERWDFGDGTPQVTTRSDGNVNMLAKDGYVTANHRYAKPGHYLVRVERRTKTGIPGICHVDVEVGPPALARVLGPNPATGTSTAVVVGRTALAHTAQFLPLDGKGKVVGKRKPKVQVLAVLEQLERSLAEAQSGLDRVVKINVAVTAPEIVPEIERALARRFSGATKPAVSYVTSAIEPADALLAMDAVATTDLVPGPTAKRLGQAAPAGAGSLVAVVPAGPRVYVSGNAVRGDLGESTRQTLAKLQANLLTASSHFTF
jgi:enamine deaminase RidA (YjgF/YER057c/UK114 family)